MSIVFPDENDETIRVKIRTGTSSRRPELRSEINDVRNQIIHIDIDVSGSVDSYEELMGLLSGQSFEQVLERSMRDDGLVRNSSIKLDINSYECTSSEILKECTICLQKFKIGEKLTSINCGHIFHFSCLKEWGKYKQECPLCRTIIPILER